MFNFKFIIIGTLALLSTSSSFTIRIKGQELNPEHNTRKGNDDWSLYPQLEPYGYPILDYLRGSVSAVTAGALGFMYGIYGPVVSVLTQPVISHALYVATDGAIARVQGPPLEKNIQEEVLIEPKRRRGRSQIDLSEVEDLRKFSRRTTDEEMRDMFNNFYSDNIYERYDTRRIL